MRKTWSIEAHGGLGVDGHCGHKLSMPRLEQARVFRAHRYSCSTSTSWLSLCPVIAGEFRRSAIDGCDSSMDRLFPQVRSNNSQSHSRTRQVQCRVVPDIRSSDLASQHLKHSLLGAPSISSPQPLFHFGPSQIPAFPQPPKECGARMHGQRVVVASLLPKIRNNCLVGKLAALGSSEVSDSDARQAHCTTFPSMHDNNNQRRKKTCDSSFKVYQMFGAMQVLASH